MKVFGLILIALGAVLAYAGYKKKVIKTKEGQTLQDLQNEMLRSDPNAVLKKTMGMGCSMYLKVLGLGFGITLILVGLGLLVL